MDDGSDTAYSILNKQEKSDSIRFYDILIKTNEGKSAFVRFAVCTVFSLLTIISSILPAMPYVLEIFFKEFFCLCAMVTSIGVYIRGVKQIFKLRITADVLAMLCTLVSYSFAVITGMHWFEGGITVDNDFCFIITTIVLSGMMFGDFVKNGLKNRSHDAVDRLCEFIPKNVEILRDGQIVKTKFESICRGDCAKIFPGDKIPFDAVVVEGETTVDESALTGESAPVKKEKGNNVYAGSINKYGEITIESVGNAENCLIYKLICMAKKELENEFERTGITEKALGIYLPLAVLFSVIIAISCFFKGAGIAVAVAAGAMCFSLSCPVAIAFAEPILSLMMVSKAYKNNILIQNPNTVAVLSDIDVFAFDKSGTLTRGEHIVTDVYTLEGYSENEILEYAVSIESVTEHPISDAIFEYAYSRGISEKRVDNLKDICSSGVKAVIDGKDICFGDYSFFEKEVFEKYESVYQKLNSENKTVAFITVDSIPAAIIAAEDSYKPGVSKLITTLNKSGIEVQMLVDEQKESNTSESIYTEESNFSESFADVKALKIKSIKAEGKSVAMVGDGINDTVALIAADVGISVGGATAAALEAADIVLFTDDVSDIIKVLKLGKLYHKTAMQNIILSLIFNFLLLIAGGLSDLFGFVHLSEPVIATAVVSVLSVFVNTWRVRNK